MGKQTGAETLAMRNKIYMTVQESVIGAGTGNYNKLKNIPIVNLVGASEEDYINLSGLNQGHFIIKGYYKTAPDQETMYQEEPLDLYVLYETVEEGGEEVNKKVLYYVYAKKNQLYIRMIIIGDDVIEIDEDICLTEPLIFWRDGAEDEEGGG